MKGSHSILFAVVLALCTGTLQGDVTFQSAPERTHLLELYTSEGCSSCPPAEAWLSQLRQSPRLWKEIVPIAFHVDYWDGLGWPDRFASKKFTARQRAYAAAWQGGTVYTPAFVLNGAEWRWRSFDEIRGAGGKAGVLTALVRGAEVTVSFQPARRAPAWEVHLAVLGLDLVTSVKAGENRGRELRHDFVVLSHEINPMRADGESFRATVKLAAPTPEAKTALAVWVCEAGKLAPAQAVGGKL